MVITKKEYKAGSFVVIRFRILSLAADVVCGICFAGMNDLRIND
jgi:hypothetical protein